MPPFALFPSLLCHQMNLSFLFLTLTPQSNNSLCFMHLTSAQKFFFCPADISTFVILRFAQGTVLKTEVFNQKAPKVASFSSRGPNPIAVDLLKVTVILFYVLSLFDFYLQIWM